MVNPHYFGNVSITTKNSGIVNFITIGAMRSKRRNTRLLTEAVIALSEIGITNYKITVIGRGSLRGVPRHLRKYFDIKGKLNFFSLYEELEKSDFFLTLLDPDNPSHDRYITTGTSGSFQLIYGFVKPCLIAEKFARRNGFDESNSIIYSKNDNLSQAMSDAIHMRQNAYVEMQQELKKQAKKLYEESLKNLKKLVY